VSTAGCHCGISQLIRCVHQITTGQSDLHAENDLLAENSVSSENKVLELISFKRTRIFINRIINTRIQNVLIRRHLN